MSDAHVHLNNGSSETRRQATRRIVATLLRYAHELDRYADPRAVARFCQIIDLMCADIEVARSQDFPEVFSKLESLAGTLERQLRLNRH